MKLVTVSEMRAIEQEADSSGLTYAQMMENAGSGLAKQVLEIPFEEEDLGVLGLVGPGNNGGDALVAMAHLAAQGWQARAYLVHRKADKDPLVERLKSAGGEVLLASDDDNFEKLSAFIETTTVVLDGVLGTGIHLPLKAEVGQVLRAALEALAQMDWPPLVVAVDCPSGVDCDSGEVAEEAIPADLTITMAAVKQGMLRLPAFEWLGELQVADIGLTDEVKAWTEISHTVVNDAFVIQNLPERSLDSHKGTFGTALVVAGSVNYTGAALLSGKAAYRSGTGLVTLAVPNPLHTVLAGQIPEATWVLLPHEMGVVSAAAVDVLVKNLERATAMLMGPGFGQEDATLDFLQTFLSGKSVTRKSPARIGFVHNDEIHSDEKEVILPPLVVDADGLRLLAKIDDWPKLLPVSTILTPHPGEMSALTGLSVDEIQSDRLSVATRFAKEWGHVVVLKGAFTVVAAPDGRTATIPIATSALATAGTGDVLAGLVVGLRAQGLEAFEAAAAGAWIHAQAGLSAYESLGNSASVMASDVLDAISNVLVGFE
jgi:hydroxyethylthiazole kinase-like uncharacterized protein yjeF